MARPFLKLRYSTRLTPDGSLPYQPLSLPLPLPIREPATFFVNGKCGNAFSQTLREVLSVRLAPFLMNIFILKRCLPEIFIGCKSCRPVCPNSKPELLGKEYKLLDLCLFLKSNLRGRNNIYTNSQLKNKRKSSTYTTPKTTKKMKVIEK